MTICHTTEGLMDILKCKAFLSSVDSGSFSVASENMGYTPSGITRMVNSLEEEIGFSMLTRTKKGVDLNEDGKRIIPFIRNMVMESDKAMKMSNDIRGLSVGSLTIGTYSSIAIGWLPDIIKSYQSDYPNVSISINEAGNSDLLKMLETGFADCCFFSDCPLNIDWIPLQNDVLVVWLPKDHPRAKSKSFPLKELNDAQFISTLPDTDTDNDRLFKRENITPHVKYSTVDNYSTYSLVNAGLGISINNALMAKNWHEDVVTIPIDPPQYITLGIALPKLSSATLATKTFIEYAKNYVMNIDEK